MISKEFGWQQSHLQSHLKKAIANGWLEFFKQASFTHSIPLAILLAIASRETNMSNIKGDCGHGRGIMQIDDRYHKDFISKHKQGLDPKTNICYGAGILEYNLDRVKKDLPKLTLQEQIKIAISGYNGSLGKILRVVESGKDSDSCTTNKNYAADVIARSEVFNKLING